MLMYITCTYRRALMLEREQMLAEREEERSSWNRVRGTMLAEREAERRQLQVSFDT
jgi:hypothetical protein